MKKYVSSRLSDKKVEQLEQNPSVSIKIYNYLETIIDSDVPIPWFGMDNDNQTNKVKPLDVEKFIAFRVEPNTIYLEWWDLAGKKDFNDCKEWNNVFELQFPLERSTEPRVIFQNLIETLIDDLDEYVDNLPLNEDDDTFENIIVFEEAGDRLYFCQEGNSILLKGSLKGIETVLEVFDSGDKLREFISTMKLAVEEAEKMKK